MAKKTVVDKNIAEIRKILKAGNLIIGGDVGLKNLKLGKVEKIFLAANCKDEIKEEVEKLAKMSKVEVGDKVKLIFIKQDLPKLKGQSGARIYNVYIDQTEEEKVK